MQNCFSLCQNMLGVNVELEFKGYIVGFHSKSKTEFKS